MLGLCLMALSETRVAIYKDFDNRGSGLTLNNIYHLGIEYFPAEDTSTKYGPTKLLIPGGLL